MPAPGLAGAAGNGVREAGGAAVVLMRALYQRAAPHGSRRFAEAFRSRVGDEPPGVEQVVGVEGALDRLHQSQRSRRPAPDGQRLLPPGRAALNDDVTIVL